MGILFAAVHTSSEHEKNDIEQRFSLSHLMHPVNAGRIISNEGSVGCVACIEAT